MFVCNFGSGTNHAMDGGLPLPRTEQDTHGFRWTTNLLMTWCWWSGRRFFAPLPKKKKKAGEASQAVVRARAIAASRSPGQR